MPQLVAFTTPMFGSSIKQKKDPSHTQTTLLLISIKNDFTLFEISSGIFIN